MALRGQALLRFDTLRRDMSQAGHGPFRPAHPRIQRNGMCSHE